MHGHVWMIVPLLLHDSVKGMWLMLRVRMATTQPNTGECFTVPRCAWSPRNHGAADASGGYAAGHRAVCESTVGTMVNLTPNVEANCCG
eukprot:9365815-Lingulodinium_polyedra.AAC.1